jgi:hypothetical protein
MNLPFKAMGVDMRWGVQSRGDCLRAELRHCRTLSATFVVVVIAWPMGVFALFVARFDATGMRGGEQRTEAPYDLAICLVAVGAPALAAALAVFDRRPIAAAVLAVIVIVLAVFCAIWAHQFARYLHPVPGPEPVVTQCIPRSGSTRGCPGG